MLQATPQAHVRLGVVNFLNTAPLISGMEGVDGIEFVHEVPSALIGCVERQEVDIALASSIDYQRSAMDLRILPVGVLSSEGETLTVQLCSSKPLDEITEVHCDSDSHTSIALLQIVLKQKYGLTPKITSANIGSLTHNTNDWPETVLIIGDKVVTSRREETQPFCLDLGQAWMDQTGLPFVFATWIGSAHLDPQLVHRARVLLDRQRRYNAQRIEQVVSRHSAGRGWSPASAFQYLTNHMQYSFTPQHGESLDLFFELSASISLIDTVRPVQYYNE
jgi:chorismate dehydratase